MIGAARRRVKRAADCRVPGRPGAPESAVAATRAITSGLTGRGTRGPRPVTG